MLKNECFVSRVFYKYSSICLIEIATIVVGGMLYLKGKNSRINCSNPYRWEIIAVALQTVSEIMRKRLIFPVIYRKYYVIIINFSSQFTTNWHLGLMFILTHQIIGLSHTSTQVPFIKLAS